MLIAHFIRGAFEVQHRIALDFFEPTLAAAGDGFGTNGWRLEDGHEAQQHSSRENLPSAERLGGGIARHVN